MIIAGAALIMMVLDRFPILVWLGATLLGWIAGDVIATDPAVHPLLQRLLDGQIALNLDATSAVFGVSPHFSLDARSGRIRLARCWARSSCWSRDRSGGGAGCGSLKISRCQLVEAVQPIDRP